jgi:hypothetical protein
MKWLVIAIIVFAQQPVKAPPHKRATEANRTESTQHTKDAKDNQTQPPKPTPTAPQPSIVPESQRNATAGNDHTRQGDKQTSEEDSSTQRKLTWFTGVLASVGVLQLVVMFLTWLVYRRQAQEMRRQRHEMRRQRHVMLRQWKSMREQAVLMETNATVMDGQLKQMQKQAIEMEKQTGHLEGSVAAAQASAEVAKLSADFAARVSIPTLVIEKFESANAGAANLAAMLQYPNVNIVIKNYGQTPALLKFWNIVFTCGELPAEPDYWNHRGSGIVLERDVIEPNQPYTIPPVNSWRCAELSLEDVEAIIKHEKKLWAYGFICYDDIFRRARWRVKFCELALNVHEGWIQWVSYISPPIYHGTEEFPWGLAAIEGQKADNSNEAENPN